MAVSGLLYQLGCGSEKKKEKKVVYEGNDAMSFNEGIIKNLGKSKELKELSTLVSKAEGIEHNFEYGYWSFKNKGEMYYELGNKAYNVGETYLSVFNNRPEEHIHKFILDANGKELLGEIKELNSPFIINYHSDSHGTKIPNPIKNTKTDALLVYRSDYKSLKDFTDLHKEISKPIKHINDYATYYIVKRSSQRKMNDDGLVVRCSPSVGENYIEIWGTEGWADGVFFEKPLLTIRYNDYYSSDEKGKPSKDTELGKYTVKSFTQRRLLRNGFCKDVKDFEERSYREIIKEVYDKESSVLYGPIDLHLFEQDLELEKGVWKTRDQTYRSKFHGIDIYFNNYDDNKMKISWVHNIMGT